MPLKKRIQHTRKNNPESHDSRNIGEHPRLHAQLDGASNNGRYDLVRGKKLQDTKTLQEKKSKRKRTWHKNIVRGGTGGKNGVNEGPKQHGSNLGRTLHVMAELEIGSEGQCL